MSCEYLVLVALYHMMFSSSRPVIACLVLGPGSRSQFMVVIRAGKASFVGRPTRDLSVGMAFGYRILFSLISVILT